MRSRIALLAAGFALAATLIPATRALAQDCSTGASLRILNLSPDAGAVDILVNGQVAVTNLATAAGSTYVTVPAGTVKVQVNKTGTQTVVIAPVDVTTTAGGRVTIATLTTTPASGTGQQAKPAVIATQVFQDDGAPPAAGQAKLRVIHGAPDAGAVDVLAGDQKIITNLAYPSASPFIEVPAGSYQVRVNATGTTNTLIGPIALDLVAGRTYTVYASGTGTSRTANVLVDRSFDALAQIVHAAPDAPGVDVIVDGRVAVSNLAYPNATAYLPLPAGGACVVVAGTGTTTPVLGPASLSFESGSRTTIVALPATGTPPVGLGVYSDPTAPPTAGKARIRVIHAALDAGPVDVLADQTSLAANLEFGRAGNFVEVDPKAYQIRVNTAGTTTTVLGPIDLTVNAGDSFTLIVRGKVANQSLGLTLLSSVSGG